MACAVGGSGSSHGAGSQAGSEMAAALHGGVRKRRDFRRASGVESTARSSFACQGAASPTRSGIASSLDRSIDHTFMKQLALFTLALMGLGSPADSD